MYGKIVNRNMNHIMITTTAVLFGYSFCVKTMTHTCICKLDSTRLLCLGGGGGGTMVSPTKYVIRLV